MMKQLARGEREVLGQLGEIFGAAHTTIPLLADRSAGGVDTFDVPEPANGSLVRIDGRHAARFELARAHLDVKPELGIDLVFDAPAPDARPEATAEGHAPDGMSTFDTAAENRVHSSVSAAS